MELRRSPRVFISYSHDSPAHAVRVLALSEQLRGDGVTSDIDQYVNGTPVEAWPRWMLDRLDWADFVLVVCTETYYRRFRGHEAPGVGRGVDWEGLLITQEMYLARSATARFVPVLFNATDERFIPEILSGHTRYVVPVHYDSLCDFLFGRAGIEARAVGEPAARLQRAGKTREPSRAQTVEPSELASPDLSSFDKYRGEPPSGDARPTQPETVDDGKHQPNPVGQSAAADGSAYPGARRGRAYTRLFIWSGVGVALLLVFIVAVWFNPVSRDSRAYAIIVTNRTNKDEAASARRRAQQLLTRVRSAIDTPDQFVFGSDRPARLVQLRELADDLEAYVKESSVVVNACSQDSAPCRRLTDAMPIPNVPRLLSGCTSRDAHGACLECRFTATHVGGGSDVTVYAGNTGYHVRCHGMPVGAIAEVEARGPVGFGDSPFQKMGGVTVHVEGGTCSELSSPCGMFFLADSGGEAHLSARNTARVPASGTTHAWIAVKSCNGKFGVGCYLIFAEPFEVMMRAVP
jgi:hypothetical protein